MTHDDSTTSALAVVEQDAPSATLTVAQATVDGARTFAHAAKADNTRRAYRSDWQHFERWCEKHGAGSLPAHPSAVVAYVTELAQEGFRVSTIERRLVGIAIAHRAAGHKSPRTDLRVTEVLKGIRRTLGVAQKQARPLLPSELKRITVVLSSGLQGRRDAALLLLGFAGGFRRAELVALNVEDLILGDDGLTVTVRRSKSDQEGKGRKIGVPFGSDPGTCPVRAVREWLTASGIMSGPIFRPVDKHGHLSPAGLTGHAVRLIVQRACTRAGINPAGYSGHSLRAGLVTAAAKAGKSASAIMKQTGHRSLAMVQRYIRDAELFTDNASSGLGL
jgi:integrase